MLPLKLFQGFVHRKQLIVFRRSSQPRFPQFDAFALTTVPLGFAPPGAVYENPAHGFRRHGKEVPVIFELLLSRADELQPGFVNERGGLQRLARGFQA
jgi:hypothetical protein